MIAAVLTDPAVGIAAGRTRDRSMPHDLRGRWWASGASQLRPRALSSDRRLAKLGARALSAAGEVHPSACERVELAPAAAGVEQLDVADAGCSRRVDNQLLADRFEAEHRSQ